MLDAVIAFLWASDMGSQTFADDDPPRQEAASRIDLPGCVLAPGFVNLHSHIEYAAYAGLGDGLAFGPWIAARETHFAVGSLHPSFDDFGR